MVVSRRGASSRTPRFSVQTLPSARIVSGDCVAEMTKLPADSVDLVFADPPYNLQLKSDLKRPDDSRVDAVDDDWDQFASFAAYDEFTAPGLRPAAVLKPAGTVGNRLYHNISRRFILQDSASGSSTTWCGANQSDAELPRRCFTNAHETLIWASRGPTPRANLQLQALKAAGHQSLRLDHPLCTGEERLGPRRQEAASARSPEAARARDPVDLAARDLVLDPPCGTGNFTGAVARHLGRRFIGIERDASHAKAPRNASRRSGCSKRRRSRYS